MIEVIDLTGASAPDWDALAARSPRGEALQSHAWGEVKAAGGWRSLRVRIDRDGEPVAVASIQERDLASPVVRRLPTGLRGLLGVAGELGRFLYAPLGPVLLRDDADGADAALQGLRRLARRRHAALLVVDPAWEEGSALAAALPDAGFTRALRAVQVSTTGMYLPLHADEAEQWRGLNQNARRNIERCRKAGVEVIRIDASSDRGALDTALATAYRMLVETGKRRGFGDELRPADYHAASQAALIEAGHASLWMARHEGRDLAYTLVHHSGSRAVLFEAGETGSPDEDASGDSDRPRFAANFLLQWTIIRAVAEAGFATYDLSGVDNHAAPGLPRDESHPLWNLYRFKAQWGARPVQFVGAWEHAPWPLFGSAFRSARTLGERRR
jgi:lipid II:glycine glycyltransferase (peptidoglycan interpeptide bridge formation enzyme)